MDTDAKTRAQLLARLEQTRAEILSIVEPPPAEPGAKPADARASAFPRSHTMQALLSSRGLGAIGALAGGLLIARPNLALRFLRMVPASAVGKMLLAKAFSAMRGRREP